MIQSKSSPNRLTALDGLRGISSLLVLATHLKLDIPVLTDQIAFLPLRFVARTIMNTGNISVGFFFILCGFLMSYLYENPLSYISFVQKRYLRIFTVLIVAALISFSVLYLSVQNIMSLCLTLLVVPLVFRFIYTSLFLLLRNKFIKAFFLFALVSQIIVACIYYFIVLRIGAQQFFLLPKPLYSTFIFATNYTLTFIFGDYIPMVDGGYWSLVSEVMFYLIYPLIAWLLIKPIRSLSRYYWILWYFASMIVCFGLALLFKNLLAFDTAHIHFAHFFTVGMIIALLYKDNHKMFEKCIHYFESPVGQITSILLYVIPVASAFWLGYISNPYTKFIVAYGLAPFMGLAVIALISQKNILSGFLRTPIFLFLGAISFPLYVIHSPIVHVLWQTMRIEEDSSRWVVYIVFATILSIGAAYYIHVVIEKFYFVVTKRIKQNTDIPIAPLNHGYTKLLMSSLLICLVLIFVAFQQDFSLLSRVWNHTTRSITIRNLQNTHYSLLENPKLQGKFLANEDNLGILTMKLLHIGPINKDRALQERQNANIIKFRIKEVGSNTWYHESQHISWKISTDKPYPFGFPQITDSRNKWFEFELESKNASKTDYVVITDPLREIQSVYQLPKKTIINNPLLLVFIFWKKIYGAFSNRDAQVIFGIYLFAVWFVWFIQTKAKEKYST